MTNGKGKQVSNTIGMKALRFTNQSILVHMMATGLILFVTWEQVESFYAYNWTAIVFTALLGSLLGITIFKRKNAGHTLNVEDLKTKYAYISGFVCALLSVGYCYSVFSAGADIAKSLSCIMTLHICCIAASTLGSKRIFATSLFILAGPFITTLVLLNTSITIVLGVNLALFVSALIVFNLSLHRSILDGLKITRKYEHETKISKEYKTKFEATTFEDPLTQLFNRRFFDLMICEEIRRAKRAETNLSLAIIEIDCFPEYIELYGVTQGDKCIASIAEKLETCTSRGGEFMTRFAPNQFALIAPNVCSNEAIAFMSKMVDCVDLAKFKHENNHSNNLAQISISAGIAEFKAGNIIDVGEIINQAQTALKKAQQRGANNIEVYARNVFNKEKSNIHDLKTNTIVQDFRVAL